MELNLPIFEGRGKKSSNLYESEMKVLKFPQEPIPENKQPLNRMSKRALKQVGEKPNPYYPYCLQLALWALDKGKYQPRGQELELSLGLWLGEKPADVMRVFEESIDGEPMDLVDPRKKHDPEDLAAAILSEVEDRLSLRTGYPSLSKV